MEVYPYFVSQALAAGGVYETVPHSPDRFSWKVP